MRDSNDIVTVLGTIATDPESKTTPKGIPLIKFRLASTARKFEKSTNTWVDGNTNWYTVSAFRGLAVNATASLRKGDPVVVTGRLRLREWSTGEKQGLSVDLEADVIGLDLQWGTAHYKRAVRSSALSAETTRDGEVATADEPIADVWATPVVGSHVDGDERESASFENTEALLEATPF